MASTAAHDAGSIAGGNANGGSNAGMHGISVDGKSAASTIMAIGNIGSE